MARVLIFNNFLTPQDKSILSPTNSTKHKYQSIGPGVWQANSYSKRKHIGVKDLLRRIIMCVKLYICWRKYDILIVDSAITGFFVSVLSFLGKGHRRLVISDFNIPRRRGEFGRQLVGFIYKKVDHFIVHSRYDIQLSSQLYNLDEQRFSFKPFVREKPCEGEPEEIYLFDNKRPFILSLGGNARDYGTFFRAIDGTGLNAIVVAREYNLEGLRIPDNVQTFCNIPLEQCDKLVSKCMFTVFTFDGSEPSCGQISLVTSFMLGKPVICTDWIGIRDYVYDGQNGLLVKMKDSVDLKEKMLILASDRQLYKKLSEGAVKWAAENTRPEVLHERIDALLTQLISQ